MGERSEKGGRRYSASSHRSPLPIYCFLKGSGGNENRAMRRRSTARGWWRAELICPGIASGETIAAAHPEDSNRSRVFGESGPASLPSIGVLRSLGSFRSRLLALLHLRRVRLVHFINVSSAPNPAIRLHDPGIGKFRPLFVIVKC